MAMPPDKLAAFEEIWSIDTEFRGDTGDPYDAVWLLVSSRDPAGTRRCGEAS